MEWVIIIGLVIAMYIIIYKYEKRMNKLHKMVQENREKLDNHHERINKNKEHIDNNHERISANQAKLKEHHSYIERMWVTIPKSKEDKETVLE